MTPDEAATTAPAPRRAAVVAGPGSTPSTWAGVFVLGSVLGLFAIRRSFRRFM